MARVALVVAPREAGPLRGAPHLKAAEPGRWREPGGMEGASEGRRRASAAARVGTGEATPARCLSQLDTGPGRNGTAQRGTEDPKALRVGAAGHGTPPALTVSSNGGTP